MLKQTLRSLWARKRRLAGAGLAIVIGVAFLTATLVIGDGARNGIHDLFAEGNSGTDVLVRSELQFGSLESGESGTLDEALVDQLSGVDGVATAAPVIDGLAQLVDTDGDPVGGEGPPTIGTNWIDDERFPYVIADGRPPSGAGEIVIDTGAADTAGLAVGDATVVRVPHPEPVTVVGTAELGSGESLGGVTFTWFETDTAQALLLGDTSQVSGVNLTAATGTTPEELLASVEVALPEGVEAVTGTMLTAEDDADIAADFLDFFETFLLVFAGVALLVATFSIHNTMSILVAQRTRESALLRAIGASRRQILGSVTVEAVVLGVTASVVGLAVGVGLAHGLIALMDSAGFGIPTSGLIADTATLAIGLAVGIGITMVAAVVPAVRASRVAPLAALRDVEVDRSASSRVRAVIGTLLVLGGALAVATASSAGDGAMARAGLGAVLTLVGMVVVGPAIARFAAGVIGAPVAAVGGTSGTLARRNATRNPRRTAGTASALMIGTAVVALFATFAASLSSTLDELLDEAFAGDLVVVQEGFSGSGLSPDLAPDLQALPEVGTATPLAFAYVALDGEAAEPFAVDGPALADVVDLGSTSGSLLDLDADGVAVSEGMAEDRGWAVGDTVEIAFADGATDELSVRAVYENDNVLGDALIDRAAWSTHSGRADDFMVMIALADGVATDDGRAAIDAVAGAYGAPAAQDRDEYLASSTAELDQMLNVVYGLLGLAILIALIGIANTLSLSLYERTRELGLLRAVGQTKSQLRRTVRWESVILAVFGTVGGLALGTFIGWGVMQAFEAVEGIGVFAPPIPTLVVVMAVAVVAGVAAAWRPARRAARLDILDAIATD